MANDVIGQKCDEQREGDTCRTCKRLTITCLGWGARRPEWMRVRPESRINKKPFSLTLQDKKAVDEYKAGIKEQLNRAGLIRGQPRSQLINRGLPSLPSRATLATAPSTHSPIQHRTSVPEVSNTIQPSLGLVSNNNHEELPFFAPVFNLNEAYGFPEMSSTSFNITVMLCEGHPVDLLLFQVPQVLRMKICSTMFQ